MKNLLQGHTLQSAEVAKILMLALKKVAIRGLHECFQQKYDCWQKHVSETGKNIKAGYSKTKHDNG
jgi:hypothetical protein